MILDVEIDSVLDIKVEIVPKQGRIGAFHDKNLELLAKDTVRPVFKCKISERHTASLGLNYVWVDAE